MKKIRLYASTIAAMENAKFLLKAVEQKSVVLKDCDITVSRSRGEKDEATYRVQGEYSAGHENRHWIKFEMTITLRLNTRGVWYCPFSNEGIYVKTNCQWYWVTPIGNMGLPLLAIGKVGQVGDTTTNTQTVPSPA